MEINKIYHGDCMELLKEIPDGKVDLVIADPPYNIGIDEWDKLGNPEQYVKWIEKVIDEIIRVTKKTASIYLFGDFKYIADIKVMMNKKDIRLVSWIIWDKGTKEQNATRSFANLSEHILFFVREDKSLLKRFGGYIKKTRLEKGLSLRQIGELCGERWYHRGGHLYYETGLARPTKEQYMKLKEVLELNDKFDCILDNYTFNHESIRLPRNPKDKRKFSYDNQIHPNIWYYNDKLQADKYNHPSVKPKEIIRIMVKASSNEGSIVLIPFGGCGSEIVVCEELKRNWLSAEINADYVVMIKERLKQSNLHHFHEKTTVGNFFPTERIINVKRESSVDSPNSPPIHNKKIMEENFA